VEREIFVVVVGSDVYPVVERKTFAAIDVHLEERMILVGIDVHLEERVILVGRNRHLVGREIFAVGSDAYLVERKIFAGEWGMFSSVAAVAFVVVVVVVVVVGDEIQLYTGLDVAPVGREILSSCASDLIRWGRGIFLLLDVVVVVVGDVSWM